MANHNEDDSVLGTGITTRHIEAFGRTVTTTANHIIGPIGENTTHAYQNAISDIHRELRRPRMQRSVFSFAQTSPSELMRAKLSTNEIQHRALTYIPDDLLTRIPQNDSTYSLFQGFQATLPEEDPQEHRKKHRRQSTWGQNLLEESKEYKGPPGLVNAKKARDRTNHKLEMLGIRKNMCSSEILEIDKKVANLNTMRKIVLDRLSSLEDEELQVEEELVELDAKVDDLQGMLEEQEAEKAMPQEEENVDEEPEGGVETPTGSASDTFMSQSIYEKLPTPKSTKRGRPTRRKSMPIRHEHFEPGTSIRDMPAHNDMITALDFDAPFGTMVTAALDDTVRVWDLNQGRCLGLLEGHRASVRCLQVDDNIVATGSIDASIRLWDLNKAEYPVLESSSISKPSEEDDEDDDAGLAFSNPEDESSTPQMAASSMADCPLFSLEAHVSEVTALHFHKDTLVSGSADKTIRQWDLNKGRCIQTLDVLWAAAQASASVNPGESNQWKSSNRLPDASADFVGALQCFDAALACGTADGMVRLWDLRSGQVHRSLVGHTGPVTCLQFDDVHMVTGSLDRSIRIWDLRTGSIHDAFAFDYPISSMMFDSRRIIAAAGEPAVKIYDKGDGRQWDCPDIDEDSRKSIVEQVRIKDGFMIEGRRNGEVGVWTC